MKVSVIGTGYVGLVAAAAFSEFGNDVLCADKDVDKIAKLRTGEVPIFEPGLEPLVRRNTDAGRLRFTENNQEAAKHGEIIFLAVGTPTSGPDGSPDMGALFGAAGEVADGIERPAIVVNKSTVPVGTAERVARIFSERTDVPVVVASNPEFLKEGSAVDDFLRPDRVIIGTSDENARDVLTRLYRPFFRVRERIILMDARSAELTKYACNAYLATRVSFINDIANLCDALGADVEQVRQGMGSDPRIGPQFLYPGIGYGGSCFPKDTRALISTAREHGRSMEIVASAERVNEGQKLVLVRKVREHFGGSAAGKTLALLGLAFKPNTDDVREAPSLSAARALVEDGAQLRATDPEAGPSFMDTVGTTTRSRIELVDDLYAAAEQADALLLMTEWNQYRSPDFERLRSIMADPVLFDGRNQWNRAQVEALGFTYFGIGR